MRTVIFHCNRAELADTLTLFAANAAIGADLSGIHSLVLVHTSNICLLASWEKFQNRIRANPCASTAANALILINLRNVIHNMNRIVFTNVGAVAVSQAGKIAAGSSIIVKFCCLAGLGTIIIHDVLRGLQMPAALNDRTLWLDIADRNTQNFAQLCGNWSAAHRTQVRRRFPRCHFGSILVTTCAATGATVCSRQNFSQICDCLIHLYRKEL